MKNTTIFVAVIALLGLGAWYYMSTQKAPAANDTAQTVDQSAASAADMSATPAGPVKEFVVTGSKYAFSPATLSVKKGDHVKITFMNSGGMHDFVIDELNVRTNAIQGGGQEVVEFDATQAGTFEYYCSVGNHRAMGMQGTLTVTE